jgi:hypothetical protein
MSAPVEPLQQSIIEEAIRQAVGRVILQMSAWIQIFQQTQTTFVKNAVKPDPPIYLKQTAQTFQSNEKNIKSQSS